MPETLSVTSFLALPLLLSTMSFFASVYFVVTQNYSTLFVGFLPKNITFIDPIITIIEIISFVIRLFSLAIRLFINILAGHILLKFISIIIILLANSLNTNIIVEFMIVAVNVLLFFLELMACLLQSVILTSLVVIYVDGALNFKLH